MQKDIETEGTNRGWQDLTAAGKIFKMDRYIHAYIFAYLFPYVYAGPIDVM